MGWILVEQGWTLYFTSGVVSLDPFGPQKMAFEGPRTPQKLPFLAHGLKKKEYYQDIEDDNANDKDI